MRILIAATALIFLANTTVQAETFPVIKDQMVLKECGECHMAFPPQTMRKAAWEKIMGNLSNHFGEDASLEPAVVGKLLAYHVANSSDVSNVRAAKKWRANTTARIIDGPRFIKKHRQCPPETWTNKKVLSKANCLACHPTMQTTGSTRAKMKFLPVQIRKKCGEEDD